MSTTISGERRESWDLWKRLLELKEPYRVQGSDDPRVARCFVKDGTSVIEDALFSERAIMSRSVDIVDHEIQSFDGIQSISKIFSGLFAHRLPSHRDCFRTPQG